MKSGICVKQHDVSDCGVACLCSVSAHYGHQYPIAKIRQWAHATKKGTNIFGLIQAAEKMGLSAKGVKAQYQVLEEIPMPVIAHVIDQGLSHFVVIYKKTNRGFKIMDPGNGELTLWTDTDFKEKWSGILIIIALLPSFKRGDETVSTTSSLFELVRPHISLLVQSLFGSIICTILGLASSIYIGKITDYVFTDGNQNLLRLMSIAMVLVVIVRSFISLVRNLIITRTSQLINISLIMGYYKHVLKLPQSFYDTMRIGEIISRINDAGKITIFINDTVLSCIVGILSLIFATFFMFLYSVKLTIVIFSSLPIYVLIFWIYNKMNRKYQRRMMEKGAKLQSQLVESLNLIGTVKKFGIEEFCNMKTEFKYVDLLKDSFNSIKMSIFVGGSMEIVSSLISIFTIWFGATLVLDNVITPGTLIMFFSLIGYFTSPVVALINANRSVQDAKIAVDRLYQILDLDIEDNKTRRIEIEANLIGDIIFDNVSFRFGSQKLLFSNLNLQIKKGEITAIVGKSGSGKTTLSSLILQLYPIERGRILIGDYDLSQIDIKSLRQHISTVPQKIELFAGSLIDNIAIGDTQPNMRKIADLLHLLKLEDFVHNLPEGLETLIGENNSNISGGEAQRIAIARALYRNPDILIMDEATSSLDTHSEEIVKNALTILKGQGCTIITIAHRLSSIKYADTIIVLDKGTVVEKGSHNLLLQEQGHYAQLWGEQLF